MENRAYRVACEMVMHRPDATDAFGNLPDDAKSRLRRQLSRYQFTLAFS